MHIQFLTPYFNQPRGNSTTIKRLVHFLQRKNINASVIPYLEHDFWHFADADLYHILHATRFIKWKKEHSFQLNRPYLVTMGGTDINIDLQKSMTEEMFLFLDKAAFITVFTEDAREKVIQLYPDWKDKSVMISQGVWLPWKKSTLKGKLKPRILLPAGLRPVKDVLHVLPALDDLVNSYHNLDFTILGAKLDETVYQEVQKSAEQRSWMKYVGVVPYEVMKVWYDQAQLILNTSISEGQSLALMEAMALGRPVIARKNAANLQLIQDKQTGWLYETIDEFKEAVHSIVNDDILRENVIMQAKKWVQVHHSPEKEIQSYIDLYKRMN